MNIILLNGPPRSGKDTIAELLSTYHSYTHMKFAGPLRQACRALLPFPIQNYDYEELKEKSATPGGATFRDLMIAVSETAVKPTLGDDYFGRLLATNILCAVSASSMEDLARFDKIVISDSGFSAEAEMLLKILRESTPVSALVVHLHRRGTSFAGDSRSHITISEPTIEVHNDARPMDAVREIMSKVLS